MTTAPRPPSVQSAIRDFFDGDEGFYDTFFASCIQQFQTDIGQGDGACERQDAAELRRVAHSLKSVLKTLGYPDDSMYARGVEDAAHQGPWEQAASQWRVLRQRLLTQFQSAH